jgi:hypothetical protein
MGAYQRKRTCSEESLPRLHTQDVLEVRAFAAWEDFQNRASREKLGDITEETNIQPVLSVLHAFKRYLIPSDSG